LEQALAIQKKVLPPDHPDLARSLNNLGALLWHKGDRAQAWSLLSQAVTAATTYARRFATASAQRDHPDLLRLQRLFLDNLCSAAVQTDQLAPAQRADLLQAVLQAKGISTAALTSRRDVLLTRDDPAARVQVEALQAQQRRLADLLLQGPGHRAPKQYRADCLALAKGIDARERSLAQQVQAFAIVQQTHTATPVQLARRLPAGTVLAETIRYAACHFQGATAAEWWGPPRFAALLLWAGVKEAEIRLVDLGEAAPLEEAIVAWRRAVQPGQADPKTAQTLRTRLWQPLAQALPPNTQRLVVAPDGALALVPFEAISFADGKYLVESLRLNYVSSGRDLMPLPLPKERSQRALLLSDPDYDLGGKATKPTKSQPAGAGDEPLRAGLRFRSLPGFAREAQVVGKLLGDQPGWKLETLARGEATEEALTQVARPRLLYCITHGFFLQDVDRSPAKLGLRELEMAGPVRRRLPNFGEDPRLRSGLALAGANQWQERSAKGLSDGLLTALEVEQLDLWGTELVVLSACETGLGQVQVGEGVLGLRRAFQLAGAQTVVASLWKVPDAETETLMTAFLSRWLKGQGKADALRQAQLDMIRQLRASPNAHRRAAPPLYWAGFICHGQAE
jgi:CHAT domain-containing protein